MMDYRLLEALLAVEREGNFERAAHAIGVTPSAISQRIKLLEERYGGIMVYRNPTKVSELGQRFCRHAASVKLLEQNFIGQNDRSYLATSEDPITVHIAVNDDSLSSWFEQVFIPPNRVTPKFYLDVEITDQDFAEDTMRSEKVLAAISSSSNSIQGFKSHYLGKHIYKATASPEFCAQYFADGVNVESISKAPSLRYFPLDDLQLQWMQSVFGQHAALNFYRLPSSYGFVKACRNSVAWGMNPALMVDKYIERGELVELIPGKVLAKPLYWHVSRVVLDTISCVTNRVLTAARQHLDQS